jgi:hypothetical protein
MRKLFMLLILCLLIVGCGDRSSGSRTGQITKLSYKGLIWKTWEGDMLMGGLVTNTDGGSSANVWSFSVDAASPKEQVDSIVNSLQEAINSGRRVKVQYKEELFIAPWRAKTCYIVQSVTSL